jgi:hypothetical protein
MKAKHEWTELKLGEYKYMETINHTTPIKEPIKQIINKVAYIIKAEDLDETETQFPLCIDSYQDIPVELNM